jgi:putative membrane protein
MVGWHNTPWMWLSMVVFWALLIVFIYFAFRAWRSPDAERSEPAGADILKQRLARGEISPEEYHDRLATIEVKTGPKARI